MKVKSLSHVRLFATPWTVAYQAPPSMGFSRQEYWSGLPFPSPGDLPDPGIKPGSPSLQADTLLSEPPGKPFPMTDAWTKKLWYIYTMEYYSAIKRNTCESVLIRWKSEREKQISYINAYMWKLERCCWWTYLQGGSGDVDIEKRLVNTGAGKSRLDYWRE